MRCATVITAFLLGSVALSSAMAFEKPPYKAALPIEQGPFHHPGTDSYFELRISEGVKPNWHNTRLIAARHVYKGRQGRLAVIKDLETLNFIREHFRFNEEAWIGLQFFCKFRKLLWVTGEIQPLGSPGMWAPTWYRDPEFRCSNQHVSYLPVYLTEDGRAAASWQATGPAKFFKSYLVEYPSPPADTKGAATNDEKDPEQVGRNMPGK